MFPKHVGLIVRHNQHKLYYEDIGHYLGHSDFDYEPGEREAIVANDELWEIQWYPDTPVGCCVVVAATFERAVELANRP